MADFTNIYNSIFYDNTASGSGAPDIFVNDDRPTTMDIRRNMLQVPIDPAYGSANQGGGNPFLAMPPPTTTHCNPPAWPWTPVQTLYSTKFPPSERKSTVIKSSHQWPI